MNEATYVEGFHNKSEVSKMVYKPLGLTGLRVSQISLGGGPLGGIFEHSSEEEAILIVNETLKCGVNYIDTAPYYGQGKSEAVIGKALKNIPRKAYYIATKVGRYDKDDVAKMFDFSAERVRKGFERSLELLGLDSVDVLQVHDIEFAEDLDQIVNETLPTVQQLVKEGKARFIGINSLSLDILKNVVGRSSVKIDTVLSYSRCTLIENVLEDYIPYFQSKGIGIINAGVLALGLLTDQGPQPWHPASAEIKEAAKKAAEFCQEKSANIARLVIQYSVAVQGISTNLIGATKNDYMKQNIKAAIEKPTETDLKIMKEVRERYFEPLTCKNWEGKDVVFEKLRKYRSTVRKSKTVSDGFSVA